MELQNLILVFMILLISKKVTTGSEGGLSLNTTMFTKDVFKKALESYYNKTHNQAFYNNFVLKSR